MLNHYIMTATDTVTDLSWDGTNLITPTHTYKRVKGGYHSVENLTDKQAQARHGNACCVQV